MKAKLVRNVNSSMAKSVFRCTKEVFVEANNLFQAKAILQNDLDSQDNFNVQDAKTWEIQHSSIKDYGESLP